MWCGEKRKEATVISMYNGVFVVFQSFLWYIVRKWCVFFNREGL